MLNSISDPIFVKDRQHRWVFLNDAFCNFMGYSQGELIGKSDYDFFPKAEADVFWEKDELVFTTAKTNESKEDLTDALGITHVISTKKSLFEDKLGEKFLVATITDITQNITEYQRVEAELEKRVEARTQELTQINELLLEEVVERKQAEVTLRQSEAQLRQQAQELEKALHELQRSQTQLIQSEKMSSLGQLVAGVAHEINNPVNFIFGNLAYADEYIQDLLKLLQLYQKNYPQPVPEIEDFAEVIELDFLKSDLPQLLNSMKVGTDRIREIVLSLRTFSRLDEAEMKAIDIHSGIDSTLMILQSRIKANGERPEIQVIKEYSTLPLVECYAGQLNQVFMNILANAIDSLESRCANDALEESLVIGHALLVNSPEQRKNPQIRIRTEVFAGNQVTIRIADNGTGMPEKVKQRLFDLFFTTKPIGKGTGMGLSISYQIITERHGGSLQCISELGQGTEFIITIPLFQKGQISNS